MFVEHVRLLASYNEWMNVKLYAAAASMPPEALAEDTGGFFGSLLGTLDHIVVGDTVWLKRFAQHPAGFAELAAIVSMPDPTSMDQIVFTDFAALRQRREWLDGVIIRWADTLTDEHLSVALTYASTKGVVSSKRFASLVMHLFNHQAHHRGQATTLLSQVGIDVGITDLVALIPDQV